MDYYWQEALYAAPFALLGGALCFLLRRRRGKMNLRRELLFALLVCYAVELAALLLAPRHLTRDFWRILLRHMSPRAESWAYYAPAPNWRFSLRLRRLRNREALANALLFLPFGALVPQAWQGLGWRTVPLGLLLSAAVETLQMPLGRSADIRDVLMNTLGAAAGCALYALARGIKSHNKEERK